MASFHVFYILLALLPVSLAHFSIEYPYWRGDSFSTQWERPCGSVNQTTSDTNRTQWPIDGGSLVFKPHHLWAFTFVNLGLGGSNTTTFNISLVDGFNQTGNGTFCFPKITLPADLSVKEGTNASIQVVQVNEQGSALYNCADITFSGQAKTLGEDACSNSTGVGGSSLTTKSATSSGNSSSSSSSSSSSPSSSKGAGTKFEVFTGLMGMLVPVAVGYHLV